MGRSWTVRPSPIHGFGVFATQLIPQGNAVGAMDCVKFPRSAMRNEPATGVVVGPNQMAVMGGFPLWYLNYSDDPNVSVIHQHDEDTQPFVVALRMIHPGEELTLANAMNLPI